MMKLKKHQIEAVDFLADKKYAMLADDTGTGKTYSVIATLNKIGAKKLLIVCPNSIKYQWLMNLNALWNIKNFKHQVINSSTDVVYRDTDVVIINYDLIIKPQIYDQFYTAYFDVCILDESHRLKNVDSQRTKVLLSRQKIALKANQVFCLSGTPMTDHIVDFYPVLHTFASEKLIPYEDYYGFTERYCAGKKRKVFFRKREQYIWEAKGATNIAELQDKLSDFMLRRTQQDIEDCVICTELEPKYNFFKPTKEINDIIETEIIEIEEKIEAGNLNVNAEELLILKQFTSVRNKIAQEKINIAMEELVFEISLYDKVVVFVYHTKVADKIKEVLKDCNPVVIDGRDSAKKKYEKVKKFQDDKEAKVLIGQIKAMGEGIDGLQFVCNHAIFFELSLTPGDIHQAKARLLRMGQKEKTVSFSYYIIEETIEEKILKLIEKKWDNINLLLENKGD